MASTYSFTATTAEKTGSLDLRQAFYTRAGSMTIILFAVTVQLAVSCGSYSGYGKGPMFGDFEAQRHWMEVTVNLPVEQWYVNGTDNDLNYWGLDYPPLTAYHSYLLGKISETIDESWIKLHASRGTEFPEHKLFMRLSVLGTMWLLYYSIFLYYLSNLSGYKPQHYYTAIVVLYPGLISVDNGHFQYNHIALGLFLVAYVLFAKSRLVMGSLLFVLAVHFKQMELYHALPIAFFLLSIAIRLLFRENFKKSLIYVLEIGLVIFLSIVLLWLPLRRTEGFPLTILYRIFPFYRGIFEDKVANFWCAINVLIKLKQAFSIGVLVRLSTLLVLLSHIPLLLSILWRPNNSNLRQGLFLSALSFFLFSFHVHEKSILFSAVPALLLWPHQQTLASWFLIISDISIYPLCIQDGNSLHLALFLLYYVLSIPTLPKLRSFKGLAIHMSCVTGFLLCLLMLCLSPPKSLPHIFPLFTALYSFAHFVSFFLYANVCLFNENFMGPSKQKRQ